MSSNKICRGNKIMNRILALSMGAFALASSTGLALAQTTVATTTQPVVVTEQKVETGQDTSGGGAAGGAATGAIAGAVVGGPVGAVVGGLAGAVTGDVAEDAMTPETRTYVLENRVQSVPVDGQLVIGTELPQTVDIQQIPNSEYRYVYVNEQPVIVDPGSRKVVHILR
jgi:outer membrane lipoprotein SlyB